MYDPNHLWRNCAWSFLGPTIKKMMFCSVLNRFKFDDERVTKEELKRALEEQYGGEEEVKASMVASVTSCVYL